MGYYHNNMSNPSQADRIKNFLSARAGQWVSLKEILELGIAQYNARLFELRREGLLIENKTKKVNGQIQSWYRYIPDGQRQLNLI